MRNKIINKDFEEAEKRLQEILNIVTQRGGFQFLTPEEVQELNNVTRIVKFYEDIYF